ncbi:hypothetical protein DKP78_22200, partial [Enterococcus faecium]
MKILVDDVAAVYVHKMFIVHVLDHFHKRWGREGIQSRECRQKSIFLYSAVAVVSNSFMFIDLLLQLFSVGTRKV